MTLKRHCFIIFIVDIKEIVAKVLTITVSTITVVMINANEELSFIPRVCSL